MSTSNSTLASYATSVALVVKGFFSNVSDQISVLSIESKIGILLGLATYATSLFFLWRKDRREERAFRRQRGQASKKLLPVIAAGTLIAVGAVHQVTQRQYDFTSGWEGVRYVPYEDPAVPGRLTVCRGITNSIAPGWVRTGKTYTPQECYDKEVYLMQNLIAPALAGLVKVPTTQQQREMLGDFAWNKGIAALASSTLMRKLNSGDCWGAADEWDRWLWAGGRRWASIGQRNNAAQDNFRKWCKP